MMSVLLLLFFLLRGGLSFSPSCRPSRQGIRRSAVSDELVDSVNADAPEVLKKVVMEWSEVGQSIKAANRVSGGSAMLEAVTLTDATEKGLTLATRVVRKPIFFGKPRTEETTETIKWNGSLPLRKRFVEAACELKVHGEAASLLRGEEIMPNLWLNNVPASRDARQYISKSVSKAVIDAVNSTTNEDRFFSIFVRPPELDDTLDTYRVGTLLELTRSVALDVVKTLGLRVRICVQGPMGTGSFQGLPLSLNGVRKLLESMDWGDNTEELFDQKYIRFGAVTNATDNVDDMDDVFLILCPQSTVGCPVVPGLMDLTTAAKNKAVIILNPKLQDVQSSQGVMSVRGRKDRMDFADSFKEIFRFATVVPTGRTFFPILGAVVRSGLREPYVVYDRREETDTNADMTATQKFNAVKDGSLIEYYRPIAAYQTLPDNGQVLNALKGQGGQKNNKKTASKNNGRPNYRLKLLLILKGN